MFNNVKKGFNDFSQLYSLPKTLRFELKPIGKTRKNIEKANPGFIRDREIKEAYQILKPVFDLLHEEFITNSLESPEAKKLNIKPYFEIYKKMRTEQDKGSKNKLRKEIEKIEKDLRKYFEKIYEAEGDHLKKVAGCDNKNKEILKERGFKVLTEDGILKYIKLKFLENKNNLNEIDKLNLKTVRGKIVTRSDLEKALGTSQEKGVFEGFFTYLNGFNQNRENYYSTEEKSTAVANRVIADNLPRFIDNLLSFEKYKNEILEADTFLKEKGIDLSAKNRDGNEIKLHKVKAEFFNLNYFANCLSSSEIEEYNLEIGNFNNLINRYNQQRLSETGYQKIPKLKILYKQIGCGQRKDFILNIKDDNELGGILSDIKIKGKIFFTEVNKLFEIISNLDNFNGVYWNDRALNTISGKYFSNWSALKELLKDAKIFKADKNDIKIPLATELSDLFEVLDNNNLEFKKNFKENNELKQKIIKKKITNSSKLLEMILIDVKENQKLFDKLKKDLPEKNFKKDKNAQKIKNWLDTLLSTNQIIKFFKVRENKISGSPLNTEVSEFLDKILFIDNPVDKYDLIRNYLTKKPTEELNKLKLNFNTSTLAKGWDVNKEIENQCLIIRDIGKNYLLILTEKSKKFFGKKAEFEEVRDTEFYQKMNYKLLPGPNKMLPKVLLPKSNRYEFGATDDILKIYDEGGFKKNEASFTKEKLYKIIDFYKQGLKVYPNKDNSWQDLFNFNFKNTKDYNDISEFYSDVEIQGYKLDWSNCSKKLIDDLVEKGEAYLFEIRNKDNNLKDGKVKTGKQNLHTIYWNAVFSDINNKPKLNGGAEIFYRPKVENISEMKNKDKNGKIIGASKKRFETEKFLFHCPITLNFGCKISKFNKEINEMMIANSKQVRFLGIDRGERHLVYYSLIDREGEIIEQGSFNEINGKNYAELLEDKAQQRDEARKNWKTIGTIKEIKDGYISQVVRKIVDLAVSNNAFIVLEDLNIGFKRGRQKIEKSVYQKLELALVKKLNFLVDKNSKDGELLSVHKALQLTPLVQNFQDIGKQCGIMLYVRANYTSQTDPITGWRRKIYFNSTSQENLKKEIIKKFSKIGFDGKDYYFEYQDEDTKKTWRLWSGKDGKALSRFKNIREGESWTIKEVNLVKNLEEVFGKHKNNSDDLITKITNENVNKIREAIDLIQQIRNTGVGNKDNDFIQSPVRDKNGQHFDSRKNDQIPNGDANGAYNIARKGILVFVKPGGIIDKPDKPDLYIKDQDWDKWLQS